METKEEIIQLLKDEMFKYANNHLEFGKKCNNKLSYEMYLKQVCLYNILEKILSQEEMTQLNREYIKLCDEYDK